MRKGLKVLVAGAGAASLALSMAACSSNSSSGGESGSGGTESGGDAGESSAAGFEGRGPITYVQGKDNAGNMGDLLDQFNKEHPGEEVTMIELSAEADQQRESFVNNAQTKSDAYCVISLDNIWVPEFAARGWVDALPADEFPSAEMPEPVWNTGVYRDQPYAIPQASDGTVLFVRTDILAEAGITDLPETWEDMIDMWEKVKEVPEYSNIGGFGAHFYKYEGFTAEIDGQIHTNGGTILNDAGEPAANSPESVAALKRLQDGFATGFIPEESLTYREEEGRAAFEAGRIIFYANWPYQYVLSQEKLGDDAFAVTALPQVDGHPGVSSLGGHNSAISTFCKNKATALDFVKFFTSEASSQWMLDNQSLAPVYTALYEDPANIEKFPYLPVLEETILNAVPRPRAVQYGDVTGAIQDNLWPVLADNADPEAALAALDAALEPLVNQ